MSVWEAQDDSEGQISFPEIRKTGANSVRIVWAITENLLPNGHHTEINVLDALITNARRNQLIPMIELHDATGRWDRLQELVDYWVQPQVIDLIQGHQQYLLVNIGHEVGNDTVTNA
jgi:mannan endo-1,4-beta-mannosidase